MLQLRRHLVADLFRESLTVPVQDDRHEQEFGPGSMSPAVEKSITGRPRNVPHPCHDGRQRDGTPNPAAPQRVVSKNITRHPDKGIGGWTDGELAYLVRTGISRDGRYIPQLPHLADEDLASIIAFLRSDHPMTAPDAVDPPGRTQPSFLTKALSGGGVWTAPLPERPHHRARPR
jgi:hypothetical protein